MHRKVLLLCRSCCQPHSCTCLGLRLQPPHACVLRCCRARPWPAFCSPAVAVANNPCLQLIETALPKLPRIPGVTAHWLAINGVQPDLPENTSAGALPKKRRPPLGLPGQGSRLGGLQEAAAAAAAAAVAGQSCVLLWRMLS